MKHSGIGRGTSFPLGATVQPGGVNFSVYSRNGTLVELLLFDGADTIEPARVIPLEPREHRTYHYWHVFVPGLMPGQVYGFRATGPFDPARGLRFDSTKVLLDPYGLAVAIPKGYSRHNATAAMKSIVAILLPMTGKATGRSSGRSCILLSMSCMYAASRGIPVQA